VTLVQQQKEKEAFRAAVGFAVKSPFATTAGEVSHEKGSVKIEGRTEKNLSESVIFEAIGGDTLLASNPPAWIDSVMDHNNWRVNDVVFPPQYGIYSQHHFLSFKRTGLMPLADVISEFPSWAHIQAIPSYAQYIKIPCNRTLNCRLKQC
jgi:hypothetical protein